MRGYVLRIPGGSGNRESNTNVASVPSADSVYLSPVDIEVSFKNDAAEIGILLSNNQRQHRTLHIQKDAAFASQIATDALSPRPLSGDKSHVGIAGVTLHIHVHE